MDPRIEKEVLDFIKCELDDVLYAPVTREADLMEIVDWSKRHFDEHWPQFLCDFCQKFRVESSLWPEYYDQTPGLWGLLRFISRGGPDDQHFNFLDASSIPVSCLIRIAETRQWIYPFTEEPHPPLDGA